MTIAQKGTYFCFIFYISTKIDAAELSGEIVISIHFAPV